MDTFFKAVKDIDPSIKTSWVSVESIPASLIEPLGDEWGVKVLKVGKEYVSHDVSGWVVLSEDGDMGLGEALRLAVGEKKLLAYYNANKGETARFYKRKEELVKKIETAAKQPSSSVTQAEVMRVIKATAAKFKITVKKLTIHKTHGDSGFGVADLLFQSDNHAHYNATRAMERDVRKALNLDAHFVRAEYYPSDDDDIPKGHAMIQFDLLPLK
jgi:hypothetical protein